MDTFVKGNHITHNTNKAKPVHKHLPISEILY